MIKKLLFHYSIAFGLATLLLTGCQPKHEDPTPSVTTCKLTETRTVSTQANGSEYSTTTKYEYDAQGNLIRITVLTPDGISRTSELTYDSQDFLMERKVIDKPGGWVNLYEYEYSQERLAKETITMSSPGRSSTYETSFDPAGNVTRVASQGRDTSSDGTVYPYFVEDQYRYENGKLTTILRRDNPNGDFSVSAVVETDDKGLVRQSVFERNKSVSVRDADGQVIRSEAYYDNLLRSYTVYGYDGKKNIQPLVFPLPKGHPYSYYFGTYVNNRTKFNQYSVNPDKSVTETASTTFEYEYNSEGYPVKEIERSAYNGIPTGVVTRTHTISCP